MKKLGFIVLAVVLALGLVGAAYAAWSQNLYADAPVNTGYVAATISSGLVGSGPIVVGDSLNPLTTATYTQTTTSLTSDTLTVTVENAYPGLSFTVPFTVDNTGTVGLTTSFGTPTGGGANGGADLTDSNGILTGTIAAGGTGAGSYVITVGAGIPSNTWESISLPIVCTQAP